MCAHARFALTAVLKQDNVPLMASLAVWTGYYSATRSNCLTNWSLRVMYWMVSHAEFKLCLDKTKLDLLIV